MNIGFASIYSARPTAHFVAYLEQLARRGGAKTFGLVCDSGIGTCSNHLLRNRRRLIECGMCIAGGLRSFPISAITRIDSAARELLPAEAASMLAYSSAITLSREETEEGFKGPVVRGMQERLAPGIQATYATTRQWIDANHLDAVIVYNGRMDNTAAVIQACADAKVRFVTVERSLLVGHGIWLVPDGSCLALGPVGQMMTEYRGQPLTPLQVARAARFLARKLQRRSDLEWRVYNRDAIVSGWPNAGRAGRKILILPSSRNELEGNLEWTSPFVDLGAVLPRFFAEKGIKPEECVVRGHPLWGERVGAVARSPANEWWRDYCQRFNLTYIASESKVSSQDLMKAADLVVLNGSFAALEAGALGKPIVCFGHSHYGESGIAVMIRSESEWTRLGAIESIDPASVIRNTLRYIYCIGWRYPQYVDQVRGRTSVDYAFRPGGDPGRLFAILRNGAVVADDSICGADEAAENAVIEDFLSGKHAEHASFEEAVELGESVVKRRILFRGVDPLRRMLPKGDY